MESNKVQFGQAATADFEENTYTFETEGDFTVIAGRYAIVPISEWNHYEKMQTELKVIEHQARKQNTDFGNYIADLAKDALVK